jgi:hypothetical protein
MLNLVFPSIFSGITRFVSGEELVNIPCMAIESIFVGVSEVTIFMKLKKIFFSLKSKTSIGRD